MGELPQGVLSDVPASGGGVERSSHGRQSATRGRDDAVTRRASAADDTARQKIADKCNDLKMFCRRRRRQIQPEVAPKTGANSERNEKQAARSRAIEQHCHLKRRRWQ